MGLDISFARTEYEYAFRAGSYSGFGYFRNLLAAEDNIVLDEMWGFGGNKEWDEDLTTLEPLLNHSDCDGEIYNYQAEQMLPRLKEIEAIWKSGHFSWERLSKDNKLTDEDKKWYAEVLSNWVKALERIAKSDNEYLLFC